MARKQELAGGTRMGRRGVIRLALLVVLCVPTAATAVESDSVAVAPVDSLTVAVVDSVKTAPVDALAAVVPNPSVTVLPDSVALALNLPVDGETVWTAVQMPDGATLYLRYGEPGGVHIVSRNGSPDSLAASTGPETAAAEAPPALTDEERRAMVLRILREELAGLRPATGVGGEETAYAPPEPSAPARARETLVMDLRSRPGAADSLGRPGGAHPGEAADRAAVGSSPVDSPSPPTATAARPGETPGADRPVVFVDVGAPDSRVIREEFLDSGLFRTSLILFESNQARLLAHSQDVLRTVGEVLREFPQTRIRVEGHTDRRGGAEANRRLSLARAEAVRDFLVTEMGISVERIEAVGYGEDHPLAEGTSATALTLNRRVEFRVTNPEALRRDLPNR
jgi:outer membrane protein OmpA-like peptidoglycan-associated protein